MNRRTFFGNALAAFPLLLSLRSLAHPESSVEGTQIINSGIGGNNTLDLLGRLEKDCLAHQPDLTVLMAGTNDMNSKKYIPLDQYEKNLRSIIESILKMKSQIILMNLLPVYEPYLFARHNPEFYRPEGHNGRLIQMNQKIEALANEYALSFLDIHDLFTRIGNIGLEKLSLIKNEANSNTTDGLHPTPDGYRILGLSVYQCMISNQLSPSSVVCFGDSITFGDGGITGQSYPGYLNKLLN